ncbi:sugar kinase, ribokinase [Terriglobus roseus DSM 18391]|uniref:Sugar kinase, ribokinase n=1 Tax=Terriglobus roseus (strain DSM 18391 / NRRL B-41598 / KBS 63) TaxID=926566 RepID=I3ZJA6_TERRK|nr:sugar kinase [Terriglobus roseus]AFL89324.1 sugar kinase, ribokinase [Terriglobus roseus DSM 18391]
MAPRTRKSKKIAGIGLIALDLLVPEGQEHPRPSAGGTCGNVLAILATLGWNATPIGRLQRDESSDLIAKDLQAWGVKLPLLNISPTAAAPVIVERLRLDSAGIPFHSFSFACPFCGERLPSYQPVTISSLQEHMPAILTSDVLFVDRASPGAVEVANRFHDAGKIVVFEPSTSKIDHLFYKMLAVSNIVKYSHERFPELEETYWPAVRMLELQTLGRGGLRFRYKQKDSPSSWYHLHAPKRDTVVDTCGAGDWATAGLVELTCQNGLSGLQALTKAKVLEALAFAQKLGSWNCGFAGARGAMYAMSKPELLREIRALAPSQTLTMPTMDMPRAHLDGTRACRICNENEASVRRRG